MKRVVITAVAAMFTAGIAMAVPVATDQGSGATAEWEATDLLGGAPYLSGYEAGPAPYMINYGGAGITFSNSPALGEEDLIYIANPVDTGLTNDWGNLGVLSITGSYEIQNAGSVEFFSVYFLGASGALWMLNLPTAMGVHAFDADFLFGNGWFDRMGTYGALDFQSDIASSVTEVGYRIVYDATYSGLATFRITDISLDNEYHFIPEPQTYAMLGMALVSLGVTFRRRLNSAVDTVKSRIVG